MTELGTAEDFAEFMRQEREENLVPFDLDYVWMNCGPERTGKSMLAIYVGCKIDPHFGIEHIASNMEEYAKILKCTDYAKKIKPRPPRQHPQRQLHSQRRINRHLCKRILQQRQHIRKQDFHDHRLHEPNALHHHAKTHSPRPIHPRGEKQPTNIQLLRHPRRVSRQLHRPLAPKSTSGRK